MRASYVLRAEAVLDDLATLPRDELERALRALSASLRERRDLPGDVANRVESAAKAIWWMRKMEGDRCGHD
jgi:hypothetical protein